MRSALLLALVAALSAAEWRLTTSEPLTLSCDALAGVAALRLDAARDAADETDCWIELRLIAADGRRYALADPLRISAGERRVGGVVGLDAGSWSGKDGPLGADAVSAVAGLELAVHGWTGEAQARVQTIAMPSSSPQFTVVLSENGLVEVGPWREWRLRLAGGFRGEQGELELRDAAGRYWPLFLDQSGSPDAAGRWRARGPARWVLRLAPGEQPPAPARLLWRDGNEAWEGPAITVPDAVSVHEAAAGMAVGVLPLPQAEAWSGMACALVDGSWRRLGQREVPKALAPVLAWRQGWTGFRGPDSVSWPQAAALDRALVVGVEAIDLLPAGLADEQGPFRFGLSPWTGGEGPWHAPRDLWASEAPWKAWRAQARVVLARSRAAPSLAMWSLGAVRSANDDGQRQRLQTLASDLAQMVARYDRRPLLARHAQLVSFARTDPQGTWFSFADQAGGWSQGPPPLFGPVQRDPNGSDGSGCITVPVAPGDGVRLAGAQVALDINLFNLDRLELDAALDGGGEATLYAWATDHHHRWWQQRLGVIPGDGGWQTLGLDATTGWACAAGEAQWSADLRRRIRAFGVVAYVRGAAGQARLRLDRLRRLGWATEVASSTLTIRDLVPGPAALARWQPITASFDLSQQTQNPYDPDYADVIGEIEGPDGQRRRHPAYWFEPQRLDFDGKAERVVAAGSGSWRWRWTPPTPGAWRWRLVARIKVRDTWQNCESDWRTATISTEEGGMPTVGLDAADPRWFADADGRFWYPIGINLRSPGDERQDGDLARERALTPVSEEPAAIRGWNSIDWQRLGTRAYERWFPLMRANGMDWARVWMSPWWCGLEWRRDWDDYGGLTWFSQANAARMDRVMELAAANRIYVQVELMNHGMVGEHADRQWADSPYNALNGGPCRHVAEWFRSQEVWKLHAKRLRYTLARWGWCSNLAAWSLCSELEFTGTFDQETRRNDYGFSPGLQAWLEKSLTWMRENDPVPGRLTTMHWSHPWAAPQHWRTPGLGFNNSNAYTAFMDFDPTLGNGLKGRRDLPLALDSYLNRVFSPDELRRPTLLGEWGGHWSDNEPWVLRGELRTGVWLQAVTPYAGNTGFWWWLWLDITDRWGQYKAVAAFMQGEERRGIAWTPIQPRVAGSRLLAQGMRSDRAIRLYVWPRGMDQDHRRAQANGGDALIDGVAAGSRWRVQRYDAGSGEVVAERELAADATGRLRLTVAAPSPDAVFKLDRLP